MFWSLHSVILKKPSIRLEFTIFATNYFSEEILIMNSYSLWLTFANALLRNEK